MVKQNYSTPKVSVIQFWHGQAQQKYLSLLVNFSISGNIEDYEGTEEEDF